MRRHVLTYGLITTMLVLFCPFFASDHDVSPDDTSHVAEMHTTQEESTPSSHEPEHVEPEHGAPEHQEQEHKEPEVTENSVEHGEQTPVISVTTPEVPKKTEVEEKTVASSVVEKQAQVPPQEATSKEATQVPQEESASGIDTMEVAHETKGNWLYKRFWWERARKLYDELAQRVKLVSESRTPFFNARTDLDRTVFDDFYSKSGYEKGELAAIITALMKDLERERDQNGILDEQKRDALAQLAKEKEQLELLQQDVDAVSKLDGAVEDALRTLNEQIDRCQSYEAKALQLVHEIERELSDKRAKELYHEMRTSFDNVLAIESYIQGNFSTYFTTLGSKAKEYINRVMTTLNSLKERGIDLSKQTEKIREQEQASQKADQAVCVPVPTQEQGFFGWLSGALASITSAVQQAYVWITSWWSTQTTASDASTIEQSHDQLITGSTQEQIRDALPPA